MREGNFAVTLYCSRLPWAKVFFLGATEEKPAQCDLRYFTLHQFHLLFLFSKWQLDYSKSNTDKEAEVVKKENL